MEFGFEPVLDQIRAGSSYVEIDRTWSLTGSQLVYKSNSITLTWLQTGPRLVADLLARASEQGDRPNSSSLQICDQPRTCLRPG